MKEKLKALWQKPYKMLSATIMGIGIIVSILILAFSITAAISDGTEVEAKAETLTNAEPATKELTTVADDAQTSTAMQTEEPEVVQQPQWHFYNLDLKTNATTLDDYNFGPKPEDTSTVEAVETEFRKRLREDPALGAADMAWADALLGTRYLGVFYDEAEEHWDKAMNDAKDHFIDNPDEYKETLDAFFEYFDHATSKAIKNANGLTDQMYMNPYTAKNVPDIIIMETDKHEGWFLTYEFTIKETTKVKVQYRLDCGFQPTNVAEVMKVTAKSNPKVTGGGSSATIQGGGKTGATVITGGGAKPGDGNKKKKDPDPKPKPKPDPKPDPKPKYDKDPTKGTDVLPNDDPGPGPDTNNGKGAQYSTEDQDNNSNHMTYNEYQDAIKELEDANSNTGGGGDGSTPSTPPPSDDTTVDNPGSEDSGYTEPSDSSVSDDPPGEAWDGPPD